MGIYETLLVLLVLSLLLLVVIGLLLCSLLNNVRIYFPKFFFNNHFLWIRTCFWWRFRRFYEDFKYKWGDSIFIDVLRVNNYDRKTLEIISAKYLNKLQMFHKHSMIKCELKNEFKKKNIRKMFTSAYLIKSTWTRTRSRIFRKSGSRIFRKSRLYTKIRCMS